MEQLDRNTQAKNPTVAFVSIREVIDTKNEQPNVSKLANYSDETIWKDGQFTGPAGRQRNSFQRRTNDHFEQTDGRSGNEVDCANNRTGVFTNENRAGDVGATNAFKDKTDLFYN